MKKKKKNTFGSERLEKKKKDVLGFFDRLTRERAEMSSPLQGRSKMSGRGVPRF